MDAFFVAGAIFFDVAVHYGRPIWAGASCQPLCAEYMLPVASPELIASYKVKSAEHLPKAPLLHLQSRPTAWRDWFEQYKIENDEPFRGHRFDQFSMIIEACVAGLGVGLLPQYLIESQIDLGRLQVIDPRPLQTEDAYFFWPYLTTRRKSQGGRGVYQLDPGADKPPGGQNG